MSIYNVDGRDITRQLEAMDAAEVGRQADFEEHHLPLDSIFDAGMLDSHLEAILGDEKSASESIYVHRRNPDTDRVSWAKGLTGYESTSFFEQTIEQMDRIQDGSHPDYDIN